MMKKLLSFYSNAMKIFGKQIRYLKMIWNGETVINNTRTGPGASHVGSTGTGLGASHMESFRTGIVFNIFFHFRPLRTPFFHKFLL